MNAYTLRVYRLVSGAHQRTGQEHSFTAGTDTAALDRMTAYAAEKVASPLLVYLYRGGKQIGSAEGLAR